MNLATLHKKLRMSRDRHILSRYRTHIRIGASCVYLSFSIFDYLYSPQNFWLWLSLRLIFVGSTFAIYYFIIKYRSFRSHLSFWAGTTLCLACWPIAVMIYQSGGYLSLYTTGLVLCGATGVQVFRLRNRVAVISQGLAYLPSIVVFFVTAPLESIHLAVLQAGMFVGMVILSVIYGSSEEQVETWWLKFRQIATTEIDRLKKTEILKNHFPKMIRDAFERNPEKIMKKKIIPNAVVGFTDIVASSQISNAVPMVIDWEIKEKFLEAATQRAMESEMVVLTHLGDGFLFLANYEENESWYYNLIGFYENLVNDFKKISKDLNLDQTQIQTGVKFGVSTGPVMVGFLGKNQSYFTAVGPDVNLAARLCSLAAADEIVLGSRVWYSIKSLLLGWDSTLKTYTNIKGFDYPVSAVHISPRLQRHHTEMVCATCGKSMSLIKTPEGFMDYRCPDGHDTPQLADKTKKIAS